MIFRRSHTFTRGGTKVQSGLLLARKRVQGNFLVVHGWITGIQVVYRFLLAAEQVFSRPLL